MTSTSGKFGPHGNLHVLPRDGRFGQAGPGMADMALGGGQTVYHSLKKHDMAQGRVLNKCCHAHAGGPIGADKLG